ncbi:MAG: PolC-type DNA polymerase III, partial [Bradymonadaceae bacterium]
PLAVIDVETTGLDETEDRIIEIGIVHFEAGEVEEIWGQLVDPQRELPDKVTDLTGITEEDLRGQPTFDEIAEEVHDRLSGVGIVAYNLEFDRGFVEAGLERSGYAWPDDAPTFDPLVFAREFFKDLDRKNLGTIADRLGVDLEEAHRATHDAEVAGHVLYELSDRLPDQLEDLMVLQAQWEKAQAQQRSSWRDDDASPAESLVDSIGGDSVGLGPGYVYGDEPDPLRALYKSVPEAEE